MKALSVRQPHASRIREGLKTLEVRSRRTRYRGPLLICVSQRPLVDNLPVGVALCTVNVVGCRPMTRDDERAACCAFEPGTFVWELADVEPVAEPFPVSGQLGLYDVDVPDLVVS